MVQPAIAEGSATVTPAHGISGEFGTWTVKYIVGPKGIQEGGGLRVQLPDSWHSGERNSANRLQATDPADENYVSAQVSKPGVEIETTVEAQTRQRLVKHAKNSLDGRSERYVFVVRARVTHGNLEAGDVISVVYGDSSHGSLGYRASSVSTGPEPILIAVDADGSSRFHLLETTPTLRALPGEAVEMLFHAPSLAVSGKPVELLVSMVDKEQNPVIRSEEIRLTTLSGAAELPRTVRLPRNQGFVRFKAVPATAGILRLRAESVELGLTARANPILVTDQPPEQHIYWGDLHSHSRFSWDGVGNRPFQYARNISGLDFYALTDHSVAPPQPGVTRGLSEESWDRYNALAEEFNDPPQFVTLHAYECSFGKPYGHHNVYFRGQPGALAYPSRVTLPQLWKLLEAGDALTIPHHSGKFPSGIDFSIHDPRFRRNFEIYSGHGLSEAYNPHHPLSFENSTFTSPSKSLPPGTYAQDVWIRGLELSTIASSDDHRAHPGQPQFGLTALRAPALTRDDVFQALYDRRTYGTTGARIVLDFSLNGTPMGEIADVQSAPVLHVFVLGTDRIEAIELLKFQPPAKEFAVIKRWEPGSLDFRESYTDNTFTPGAIYYVRVRQRNTVRGRIVMAWSSPIWTKAASSNEPAASRN